MAAEGKRMCRKLREMLDREDSDAECMKKSPGEGREVKR